MRRRGSDTKYVAQVLAVGTECDIGNSPLAVTVCKGFGRPLALFAALHGLAELVHLEAD